MADLAIPVINSFNFKVNTVRATTSICLATEAMQHLKVRASGMALNGSVSIGHGILNFCSHILICETYLLHRYVKAKLLFY